MAATEPASTSGSGGGDASALLDFLRSPQATVRARAAGVALSLTGSAEGKSLLVAHGFIGALARLVGDSSSEAAASAVGALVNLSADDASRDAVASRPGLVGSLMEGLRDAECGCRASCVMLLVNLTSTDAGCAALMSEGGADGARAGLNFRRLVQLFVRPPPGGADEMEHAGSVLANATRHARARAMLLEPERRILPALFPQLAPGMAVARRRGAAATLRNCCFERGALGYVLGVGLLPALLVPLSGPTAAYAPDEREGMPRELIDACGADKAREPDAPTRRALVEALLLLAGAREGRDALRSARAYVVVRGLHWWLEGVDDASHADAGLGGEGGGGGVMVGSAAVGEEGEGGDAAAHESTLGADDVATIDAIHDLVDQLYRDDEVPLPAPLATAPGGAVRSDLGGAVVEGGARSGAAAASRARALRFATVPLERAREAARRVANNAASGESAASGGGGDDDDLAPLPLMATTESVLTVE